MKFLTKFLIFVITTLVLSKEICEWVGTKVYSRTFELNCTDGPDLLISVTEDKKKLSVVCSINETDTRIFNQLPSLSQNVATEVFTLDLSNCPLPEHYSVLGSFIPSNSIFKFSVFGMYGQEINSNFFDVDMNITILDLMESDVESLHHEVFANLKQLKTVRFDSIKFAELPSNLFQSNPNLETFALELNKVVLKLSDGFLANKIKLSSVSFYATKIERLPVKIFANSTNIEEIDLTQTNLQTIDR